MIRRSNGAGKSVALLCIINLSSELALSFLLFSQICVGLMFIYHHNTKLYSS